MELLKISEDTMIICIPDVKTLKQIMREFDVIGCKNVKVILDRGFYSQGNVNELFCNHQKFLMGTKLNLKYVNR